MAQTKAQRRAAARKAARTRKRNAAEKARKAAARKRRRAASRKGSRQDSIPNTTSTYWRSTSFQCETAGIDILTARVPFIGMAVIVFMLFLGWQVYKPEKETIVT